MRYMIWPRQYGKSYTIGTWWLEDPKNRVIIAATETLARIRRRDLEDRLYPQYSIFHEEIRKLLKTRVVSVRSFQNMRGVFPTGTQAAVDDLTEVLHTLLGPVVDIEVAAGVGTLDKPDPEIARQCDEFWERSKHMTPPEFWYLEGR